MKIAYGSDIHLTNNPLTIDECDAEVVILAGDIGEGINGIEWVISEFEKFPNVKLVIFVPGNHSGYCYHKPYLEMVQDMKDRTRNTKVFVLYNNSLEYNGFKFLGSTLWTDFTANFGSVGFDPGINKMVAMAEIKDFQYIPWMRKVDEMFCVHPEDMVLENQKAKDFIFNNLSEVIPNIVVTHWPPISELAFESLWPIDGITPYFYNNMSSFLSYNCDNILLWFYGHNHFSHEMEIGPMKLLSNQRGTKNVEGWSLKVIDVQTT